MASVLTAPEQRIVLQGISWETYERLLNEHQESSGTRFTFDKGLLEIMIVSFKHESINRTIARLVEIISEELEIDFVNAGSTTFRRKDLERGFEPDSCFYIQNVERIKGNDEIDLTIDPRPDLVIEVDITSPSIPRFPIYAAVGVPEVWHYQEDEPKIFLLQDRDYVQSDTSRALPIVTSNALNEFVRDSKEMKQTVWPRRVRDWVREIRAAE